MKHQIVLILYNLRSVYNTGAIFRTAEAAGIGNIYLIGTTPAPRDRFGRLRTDFTKTSLGAEKTIAWEKRERIFSLLGQLKKEKFKIIALEQSSKSRDYKKIHPSAKTAIILGNEVSGLPKKILDKCDEIGEIKMLGRKESLNVSVAAGIFIFRLLNI
jgi:tRNA G18 (ribose-2'-O)-methylase SpoU